MSKQRGFSLIELIAVVAILGILSAIAMPMYLDYVRDGIRSDAQQYMMLVALQQEQYAAENLGSGYAASLATLDMDTLPDKVDENYTMTLTGGGTSWTLTAAAKAGGMMAGETNLTLDNLGNKTGEW